MLLTRPLLGQSSINGGNQLISKNAHRRLSKEIFQVAVVSSSTQLDGHSQYGMAMQSERWAGVHKVTQETFIMLRRRRSVEESGNGRVLLHHCAQHMF